jgi:hypothetical protein
MQYSFGMVLHPFLLSSTAALAYNSHMFNFFSSKRPYFWVGTILGIVFIGFLKASI